MSLISLVLLIELTLCTLIYGDEPKVTSTTVLLSKNSLNVRSHFYPETFYSHENSTVKLNNDLEEKKIKSDIIHKLDEQSKPKTDYKNEKLNAYKRPSQFGDLSKNQKFIDKQKEIDDRLFTNQFNEKTNGQILIHEPLNEKDEKYELKNQFSQSLAYLVKYLNKQGQTKLINGTDYTKNVNNILLKHARDLDRENCLLRLICEICSNEEDASDNQLIKEIRVVFGNKHRVPIYPLKKNSSFPFYFSGFVGSTSNSAERCLEVFPMCSVRTDELLQLLANANKYSLNKRILNRKVEKILHNSKLEKELYSASKNRLVSGKMRNKMEKLHEQFKNKLEN